LRVADDGRKRLLNSWAMTAEMVPMVASRCDSVSWVRSDSSCCCNCARRSVSESASAVEVVGVVLTKEIALLYFAIGTWRQEPSSETSKEKETPDGYPIRRR
jgi:hypothetical protein